MALRDNALISNIQLSLLGIILVVGVFYIWRSLSRLEDKLDAVSESLLAAPAISRPPMGGPGGAGGFFGLGAGDDSAMDEDAERFMDNVFGNIAYSAAASGARSAAMPPPVIVEEDDAQDAPATPEAPTVGTPMPTPAAPVAPAAPAPAPIPVFVGDDAETEAEGVRVFDLRSEGSVVEHQFFHRIFEQLILAGINRKDSSENHLLAFFESHQSL